MSISLVSPNFRQPSGRQGGNIKNVLEGRALRLRNRVVKDLVIASGKRGTRRPDGLTVADRLLRHADELANIELAIADLPTTPTV